MTCITTRKNCWVLMVDFALLLLTSGMLHSHSGIVWRRVEWCGFEAKHHIKWRENDAKIRYFVENLVALWQSNVSGRRKIVLYGKLLLLADCCVGERVWETIIDRRECFGWRIVCREWRYRICAFFENGWLSCGDVGVILVMNFGRLLELTRIEMTAIVDDWQGNLANSLLLWKAN